MKVFVLSRRNYSTKHHRENTELVGVFLSRLAALSVVENCWVAFNVTEFDIDIDIKAQQVKGIQYARDLLIASHIRGFINKPESEVRDIATMLDGAAEQLKQEASDRWVFDDFGDQWLRG
ncbi:hypothetical protein [Xenorhabdus cabanillasii]|uniref:Uncharacterized protein n=1 Tax=Xenorhabdus cabanillasii JM26 TaxID=1427517 RepID=W1J568_9GAMM|nr:hypothetical protein [Xenorhabdus cabanillasii]PHM75701.1 hypothetical protein Xcab_03821 [Xenorhabdus cabanillasii JM26]CDL84986.1 hypothetical protein XCR1_2120002 [Xenorhabdus cabanillasii JM26]